jgi:dienelactone hydrolase
MNTTLLHSASTIIRLAGLAGLLAAAGCVGPDRYDPSRWTQEFAVAPEARRFEDEEIESRTGARLIRFQSTYISAEPRNNVVWGELYARSRPAAGGIVLLPGLGGGLVFERTLASSLAERGYAVYLMYLPHTFQRSADGAARDALDQALSTDMARNEAVMVQTVRDARRSAAMLEKRYPALAGRIGVMGTSFGGMMASIAYASDETFKAGVFCLAGGHIAESLWSESPLTAKLKARLAADGWTLEKLRQSIAPLEPLHYARPGRAGGALILGATQDLAMPAENAQALADAFGGARVSWLAGNHIQAAAKISSKIGLIDIHLRLALAGGR